MLKRLFILCFVFFTSFLVANAQEANIYVTQLKTSGQVNYSIGDTVRGNFNIYNTADIPQSDLYIKISTYFKSGEQGVLSGENIPLKDLYLDAHSKKTIPFEYKLPKETAGEAVLMVQAYTSDGTIKGEATIPVSVTGTSTKTLIAIKDSSLMLNSKKFNLQVGPTVLAKDDVQISFSVGALDKTYDVKPIVTLYNRTSNSEPIKSIPQDQISLKSNGEYSFKLPANLDPLVYEGVLSFESNNAQIQPIAFRYITKGDIGTIINANTDVLGGTKGIIVNVKVSYGGNPIAFNLSNGTSTATSTGTDATATISVSLSDKDGNIVGTGESSINLKDTGDVTIPVTLNKAADMFSISSVMTEGDKVLSKYNVQLPAKEKGLTSTEKILFSVDILIGIVILGLLLAYKKNKNKVFLIIIIILAVLIASLYAYQKASALTVLKQSSLVGPTSPFKINSVISPLPNDVASYGPGEEFSIKFNATFATCTNEPWRFGAYGPNSVWWSHDASYYQSLNLNYIQMHYLWIGGLGGSVIFVSDLAGPSGNSSSTLVNNSGYYSSSGNGHYFFIPTYYITGNQTYKMPTTPGIYDFPFMVTNASSNTYDEGFRVVSQKICVRGAGLCIDETNDTTSTTTTATTTTDTDTTPTSTSTTDVNTDTNTSNSTCDVSVLENNQGLTSTSTNLCVAGQTSSNFEISPSTPTSIYRWVCTNSTNTLGQCKAQCASGLNYCTDTNTCSSECSNGDRCSIPGIQKEDNPIFKLLGCNSPTLTLSVKFNKPYANDTTSKCSVNWSTSVTPLTLSDNYTTCKLDGVVVANKVSDQPVSIGQHNLVCETKVEGDDFTTNSESFVTSGPVTKIFKCSRVPVSGEN